MRAEQNTGPLDRVLTALRTSSCRPKKTGTGWSALCPAHADRRPSLTVNEGRDGRALLKCHAGCAPEEIVASLGIEMADLFEDKSRPAKKSVPHKEVAAYDYTDEQGRLLFQCVRFVPKDFKQRRPNGNGGWIWNLDGVRRVLYNLPLVVEGVKARVPIYIPEGEKDCDRLNEEGGDGKLRYVATTNVFGAGKWRAEYSEVLHGADVRIIADKDDKGRKHAREIAASLKGIAKSVRVFEAGEGKDVSEHLDAGLSLNDLVEIEVQTTDSAPHGRVIAPQTFDGIEDPNAGAVDWLVENLLPKGEVTLLAASWKTGKTLLTYEVVLAALRGELALGRFKIPRPLRVSVFQLEMPWREDLRRFRKLALGRDLDPTIMQEYARSGQLAFFSRPLLNLGLGEDIAVFHECVRANDSELVIVDSAVAAFAGYDLNDNSQVRRLLTGAFQPLTTEGRSVLLDHHYRKPQGAGREEGKAAVLGAGQFGAAAGAVYGLERLKAEKTDTGNRAFNLRLHALGSWSPDDLEECIVHVEDNTDGTATTVRAIDGKTEQTGALNCVQQAAWNIRLRVKRHGRVSRKDALTGAVGDLGVSDRTAERGLDCACIEGWVRQVGAEDAKHNERDLVPGDDTEMEPE